MKFVTFKNETDSMPGRAGLLIGRNVMDIAQAAQMAGLGGGQSLTTILDIINAGEVALDICHKLLDQMPEEALTPLNEVRLLAPLPRPEQMRDFLCFEQHLKQAFACAVELRSSIAPDPEAKRKELLASGKFDIPQVWYEQPIYYKCNRFAISGPGEDVLWPSYSKLMDYEFEFAAVIGRKALNVEASDAAAYIFGYTIFNDFSARDTQAVEMEGLLGPGKGKDFDGANALGPCIVTPDEIGDVYNLDMVSRINGKVQIQQNTSSMNWKFEDCIAHVSRCETLYPGEIIGSGTVGGGCGIETGQLLQDGDVIELEIEKIGILKNKIIRSDEA